ncbi:MAG TPA: efflux RND transporter periplasmic adaptor subunit, partial [bacterium]|nr:efflux RND transporter periplasmic adaptor subunit [bacterium]
MQKFKITFILFAITALFISCSKNSAKQENDASVKKNISKNTDAQKIYPIKILELKPEKINDYLQVVGITSPDIKINLSSFSGGLVEKMYYNEGAFVNKGDTLAEVDLQLQLIRLKKFMA